MSIQTKSQIPHNASVTAGSARVMVVPRQIRFCRSLSLKALAFLVMSLPSRLKQFLLFGALSSFVLTDSDRPEILASSLGDRERFVKLSGIHILLHGYPALESDVAQNLSQLLEAHYPLGRFAERAHGNGFRKWN